MGSIMKLHPEDVCKVFFDDIRFISVLYSSIFCSMISSVWPDAVATDQTGLIARMYRKKLSINATKIKKIKT
jgi:hypothetical protein